MFDSLSDLTNSISSTVSNAVNTNMSSTPVVSKTASKGLINSLSQFQKFLIFLGIFATPFFFLPITLDWFEQIKVLFVTIIFGLSLLSVFVKIALGDRTGFISTSIDKALLFLLGASIVSAVISANQLVLRVNSLLSDPVLFLALVVSFMALVNSIRSKTEWSSLLNLLLWSIVGLGTLNSLQVIVSLSARVIQPLRAMLTAYPIIVNISPSGAPFILVTILALVLPIIVGLFKEEKSATAKTKNTVLLALCAVSLVILGWFLFVNRPIVMDHDTARKIATGVMSRSWANALFGIGPSQFVSAFTLYRSTDFNLSPYWDRNFAAASNLWFYLLTIGGLASAASLALVAIKLYRIFRARIKTDEDLGLEKYLFVSLGLALVISILVPMAFMVLWVVFVILGLLFSWYQLHNESNYVKAVTLGKGTQLTIGLVALIILVGSVYGQSVNFAADTYYRQSIDAVSKNRGVDTYNLQVKAAQTAPWRDFYRVSLSQTNLALANSLAARPGLSDQEKQTVVQLVQQSLAEARNAVALNPNASANWQNLATIYRSLVNFAQGADQWSVSTENQAIALNPFDPRLRLDLGGIYYSLGDYQNAAINFSLATQLKADYANAHYNLAQALKQLKVNDRALQELQIVSQLVCANPATKPDCDRVNTEISDLNKPAAAAPAPDETKLATQSAAPNLPNAKTQPQVKISSPSGELAQ